MLSINETATNEKGSAPRRTGEKDGHAVAWKLVLTANVIGEPKGQPRVQAFSRCGHASVYTPKTAAQWKQDVCSQVQAARGRALMLIGPVRLSVVFFFPRPGRLLTKKAPEGSIQHTQTPDIDNSLKAVMDAMTEVGIWKDDAQVSCIQVEKLYALKGGKSGAIIQVFSQYEEQKKEPG